MISKKKGLSTPWLLLSGLFTAQVGFMILVYASNHELLAALKAIHGTGAAYFTIPAGDVVIRLGQLSTAFNGGLFFTFTLGAGLSVATFSFLWVWHHLFGRNKTILCIAIICWVGCVGMLNYNDSQYNAFQFIIRGTLLLIPVVVFFLTVVPGTSRCRGISKACLLLHISLLFLSVGVMGCLGGNFSFSNFRDTFLLSNPAGIMINDFYYRYTLHAARVFKPLEQRTVHTCSIDVGEDDALEKRLQKILVNADFFPVPPGIQVDLTITKDGQQLWFSHRGKRILQCGTGDFLRKPSAWLKQFSSKTDGLFRFRKMIYLGLVVGSPLFAYLFLCALLQIFLGKMGWSETRTEMTCAVLVLFVGLVMVGILAYESTIPPPYD